MHARAGIEVERLEGVGQVHLVRRRVCWPSYTESGARVDRPPRATDSGRPPLWGHSPRRRSSLFKTKFIFLPIRPCRKYEQGFIIQTPLQSLIFQRVCGRHMHTYTYGRGDNTTLVGHGERELSSVCNGSRPVSSG